MKIMRWNKEKMIKNRNKTPLKHFSDIYVCPICGEKVKPEEEKFNNTKQNPYIRFFDKFYWVHKECFFVLYEGMTLTINENKDEYMVETI